MVAAEGGEELLGGPSGGSFEPSADGEGGEHDGEVGLDRLALVVIDRPGAQVGLGHAEALLDLPQLGVRPPGPRLQAVKATVAVSGEPSVDVLT